jgi:CRISPR-associated protein Cas1
VARPPQALSDAIDTIARLRRLADRGEILDRDTLTGLEGAGAAAYFRAYATLFAPSREFSRRRRRPPPDPVNVCLSLGYTLLHHEAVRELQVVGLDPLLGFLHVSERGRESLASDIVEPLRPHVDEWVWRRLPSACRRGTSRKRAARASCKGRRQLFTTAEPLAAGCAARCAGWRSLCRFAPTRGAS